MNRRCHDGASQASLHTVRPYANVKAVCGASEVGDGPEVSAQEDEDGVDGGTVRPVRRLVDPQLPPKADVEAHELTHLPYRNWCRHCVAARGKELAHSQRNVEKHVPEFHLDYCFPGDRDGVHPLTVLVVCEKPSMST